MSFRNWLQNLCSGPALGAGDRRKSRRLAPHRPRLEVLEDRTVPSGYQQINLAGYLPGLGHFTDPNLNGWGMASMPNGSFCVANAFTTGLATFYDRSGHVLPQSISVPASAAQPFGPVGHPTGVVYNETSDFVITANGHSAPARLIFDTIDGTISGWNPDVDPTHAIVLRDTFAAGSPSVYTGLDIAQNSQGQNVLYAADVLNNRIEMFDGGFNVIGSFTDSNVTGLGAWQVESLNDKLYVTFANPFAPISGPHGGVVDVFDTDGNLLTPNHFAANAPGAGPLENPWGITQAPANFGAYSNALLIGNVAGAGNINAFDATSGAFLGQLRQPNGAPIAITGLWDLDFGEGTPQSGKTNQLFFDARPNAPGVSINGLFGVIRAAGDQGGNRGSPMAGPIGENQTFDGSVLSLFFSPMRPGWEQGQGTGALALRLHATPVVPPLVVSPSVHPLDGFVPTVHTKSAARDLSLGRWDSQLSILISTLDADQSCVEALVVQM